MTTENNTLKQNAKTLAEKFGFDQDSTERLMVGVMGLVEHAVKKGEPLTCELIELATFHWFKVQEKFYHDYLHNLNGVRDKLHDEVYEQLKKDLDSKKS